MVLFDLVRGVDPVSAFRHRHQFISVVGAQARDKRVDDLSLFDAFLARLFHPSDGALFWGKPSPLSTRRLSKPISAIIRRPLEAVTSALICTLRVGRAG